MKKERLFNKIAWAGLFAVLATSTQLVAGSFSSNFNGAVPVGTIVLGNAAIERNGGISNSGVLRLTSNAPDQVGAFVINSLDPDKAVSSFTARFKVRTGGGNGGEGFSFNLASEAPSEPFGEEGVGLGLTVSFDTFSPSGPAVAVKYRGSRIASARLPLQSGDAFVDVSIRVDPDGTVDVTYGGTVVHAALFAYTPVVGQFAIGARTSDRTDAHFIDDLEITTSVLALPFVRLASPTGANASPNAPIVIELQDFETKVDQNSIKLSLNGQSVTPAVSKTRSVTRIEYQPPALLESGSRYTVSLSYQDTGTPPVPATAEIGFEVGAFGLIPASFALPAGTVDTAKPGFTIRTVQARVDAGLAATLARAEAHLAGRLIDPSTGTPFVNEAIPGPNPDGSYSETGVINFEKDTNPAGSFLSNDRVFPGIPGSGGHTVNAAMEMITYLELPAGFYTFGASSDDGFRVSVGPRDARDFFSRTLGQFDGTRSVADTLFSFQVETTGIYSFRVLWYQSGGGGSMEFFSVQEDGTRVLINDRQNAAGIKAYRALTPQAGRPPVVLSVDPAPGATGVSRVPTVRLSIGDGLSKVVNSSVVLKLNDQPVGASVVRESDKTTVSFQPSQPLSPATRYSLTLDFADDAPSPNRFSHQWTFETARESAVTGQWDFNSGDLKATFGSDLQYGDASSVSRQTSFGSTDVFGLPGIGGLPALVMQLNRVEPEVGQDTVQGVQSGFLLTHSIAPNGGGTKVNEWTLLMDVLYADPQQSPFSSLLQIDGTDTDGDLFVRWNNIAGEGTGGIGLSGQYSGDPAASLHIGQWHRIGIAVDAASASPRISIYVDGVLYQSLALTGSQLDGRHALAPSFRLFADDNNELNTVYVNSVQILNGKLPPEEFATLGKSKASGLPAPAVPSTAPRLAVLWTGTGVTVSWPAGFPGYTLESTDDLTGTWKSVSGVSGTSATVALEPFGRFYRLRKAE